MTNPITRSMVVLALSTVAISLATVGSLLLALHLGVHSRVALATCALPGLAVVGWATNRMLRKESTWRHGVSPAATTLVLVGFCMMIGLMSFVNGDAESGAVMSGIGALGVVAFGRYRLRQVRRLRSGSQPVDPRGA